MYYNSLDLHFAKAMLNFCAPANQSPVGDLLCRLLSFQIRNGHVCLDWEDLPPLELWPLHETKKTKAAGQIELSPAKEKELILSQECLAWLNSSPIVSSDPRDQIRPLVWEKPRLYLYRYYDYERKLYQRLLSFNRASEDIPQAFELQKALESMYPLQPLRTETEASNENENEDENKLDRQKLAVLLSWVRPFLIISGGPGTGKTSTLARILELHLKLKPNLRIALTAPTGKAAMRIQQALMSQMGTSMTKMWTSKDTKDSKDPLGTPIPKVSTLQSLLGQSRDGLKFYHNEKKPLPLDLLLIDEASMLDLSLLARTLAALAPQSRLILLGDHHQLASVESGAPMGELCRLTANLGPSLAQKLEPLMGSSLASLASSEKNLMTNNMVVLEKNFRFGDKSGIAMLSKHIRKGDAQALLHCLASRKYADIHYYTEGLGSSQFTKSIIKGFAPCFAELQAESILRKLPDFCVLSPFRAGPQGTRSLNTYISQLLAKEGLISTEQGKASFYPIIICQNDHELDLFNGDLGLLCQSKGRSTACFFSHRPMGRGKERELREVPVELLPPYEMGFAITVHRSQGSEFRSLALLIPPAPGAGAGGGEYSRDREHSPDEEHPPKGHPLISREVLYTAFTRARQELSLFASQASLEAALANPTKRSSGLLHTAAGEF